MRPRPVLLDGSFLDALLDTDHPSHGGAVETYASLVDSYAAGKDQLFALSTVVARYPTDVRGGALAPVQTTWVAGQHRRAVGELVASSPEVAMTMLMLRRERFKAIATARHDFDQFDIQILCVAPAASEGALGIEEVPDGYVRYETEPMPARQDTGE